MKRLNELKTGDRGLIERIDGNDVVSQRLMAMAFIPGETIEVTGVAPLGDPISIQLRESKVCVRGEDAACVIISIQTRTKSPQ